MKKVFEKMDVLFISFAEKLSVPFARVSIFVIFFWFGFLKIIFISPANPLVARLLSQTLPFLTFEHFIIFFGFYEMMIGLAFLIPGLERFAIVLLVPHMITTFLPLIFLPNISWQKTFAPTLEGQYIIKNLFVVSLALVIAARLKPLRNRSSAQS